MDLFKPNHQIEATSTTKAIRDAVFQFIGLTLSQGRIEVLTFKLEAKLLPEIDRRVMDHKTVDQPASCSVRARFANESSVPFFESASICWSHASASNCANHSRKAVSS